MKSELFQYICQHVPFLVNGIEENLISELDVSRMGLKARLDGKFIDVSDKAKIELEDAASLDHVYIVGRDDLQLYWSNWALGVRACNLHEFHQSGRFIASDYSVAEKRVRLITTLAELKTTTFGLINSYESLKI